MQYLIHCPCGHALSRHGDEGCRGSRTSRCVCARSPADAFDALVRYLSERSALGDRDCPMPSEPARTVPPPAQPYG